MCIIPAVAVLSPATKGLPPMAVNVPPVVAIFDPSLCPVCLLALEKSVLIRLKKRGFFSIIESWQVILPGQLTERDSTKIALPYGADGVAVPVQKFRDVQKLYAAMTDGKWSMSFTERRIRLKFIMLCLLPVKNNLYDALEYAGQVEEAAKSHRKEMKQKKDQGKPSAHEDRKTLSTGEFLSIYL